MTSWPAAMTPRLFPAVPAFVSVVSAFALTLGSALLFQKA